MKKHSVGFVIALIGVLTAGPSLAVPVQWTSASGGNDHYYEFIATPLNDVDARAAATSSTHLGLSGYLVTITSQEEQDFAAALTNERAWIGLSDAASERTWVWLDGPEAGLEAVYTNWYAAEPNDCCGGEDSAVLNWIGDQWNDWGSPAFTTLANGYIVEYSAIDTPAGTTPTPAPLALIGLGLMGGLATRKSKKVAQRVPMK